MVALLGVRLKECPPILGMAAFPAAHFFNHLICYCSDIQQKFIAMSGMFLSPMANAKHHMHSACGDQCNSCADMQPRLTNELVLTNSGTASWFCSLSVLKSSAFVEPSCQHNSSGALRCHSCYCRRPQSARSGSADFDLDLPCAMMSSWSLPLPCLAQTHPGHMWSQRLTGDCSADLSGHTCLLCKPDRHKECAVCLIPHKYRQRSCICIHHEGHTR